MDKTVFDKENFKRSVRENVRTLYRKDIDSASQAQIYQAVAYAIKEDIIDDWIATHKVIDQRNVKVVYYLSMEFLMGRALGNNLINLLHFNDVKESLDEMGFDLDMIEDQEPDAALGNGGLGRLAACFLDSLATLGYPAYGCGIRYKYGMFKQKIEDGRQIEVPDDWLRDGNPFEVKREEYAKEIKFGGDVKVRTDENGRNHYYLDNYQSVTAVPYDIPIVGYGNGMVNTLTIWDAESDQSFNLNSFDRGEYQKAVEQQNLAKNIVEVLYPNDNHYAGKELRLKQQYFFISASIQRAIQKYKELGNDIHQLNEKITFQLNDTHPTVTVAELMRILVDEENLGWDEAWDITCKTCAYTNHTIMAEALEKWPIDLFQKLLPRIYQIVHEIDLRFTAQIRQQYPNAQDKIEHMAIIYNGQIRMAYLAIAGSYSVNGVARLHTEILMKRELKDFYEMTPWKFNNKTNGITQRRFLLHANPLLANWLNEKIGDEWITDLPQISKLKAFVDEPVCQKEFMDIKYQNKVRLANYIKVHNNIDIDPNSIYDVQVKRLHEYKRQLLSILYVMYLYNELKKNPNMDVAPRTFIYGAKAAAGYLRAKLTIKLINDVAEVINNDPSINGKIKVVFIENYRVSNAEIIFAAADVSEQISTASKEASGTGNMKLMLNGAVTLGTMDGANVEIIEEVGRENAAIFGMSADEVMRLEKDGGYHSRDIYNSNEAIRGVLDQLINGTYAPNDRERFRELYESLLNEDRYFTLKDFSSYVEAHQKIDTMYKDKTGWAKTVMLNTACSGKFTTDRTIEQYASEIWNLEKIQVNPEK